MRGDQARAGHRSPLRDPNSLRVETESALTGRSAMWTAHWMLEPVRRCASGELICPYRLRVRIPASQAGEQSSSLCGGTWIFSGGGVTGNANATAATVEVNESGVATRNNQEKAAVARKRGTVKRNTAAGSRIGVTYRFPRVPASQTGHVSG